MTHYIKLDNFPLFDLMDSGGIKPHSDSNYYHGREGTVVVFHNEDWDVEFCGIDYNWRKELNLEEYNEYLTRVVELPGKTLIIKIRKRPDDILDTDDLVNFICNLYKENKSARISVEVKLVETHLVKIDLVKIFHTNRSYYYYISRRQKKSARN